MKHTKLITSLIVQIWALAFCLNAVAYEITSFASYQSKQRTEGEVEYCRKNRVMRKCPWQCLTKNLDTSVQIEFQIPDTA